MKNRNKFDAMLDIIEAGGTVSLGQQNALHISQIKTLLDEHLAQQRNILAKFTEVGKDNASEMKKFYRAGFITGAWPYLFVRSLPMRVRYVGRQSMVRKNGLTYCPVTYL